MTARVRARSLIAVAAFGVALAACLPVTPVPVPPGQFPPLPSTWPKSFGLGTSDGAGRGGPGAGGTVRVPLPVPVGRRQHGQRVGDMERERRLREASTSPTRGRPASIPVFTYYQLVQSTPGSSQNASDGVVTNLNNASTMTAYYNDLKLFFQKAGAAGGTTVLHVEPDLWSFLAAEGHERRRDDGAGEGRLVGSG